MAISKKKRWSSTPQLRSFWTLTNTDPIELFFSPKVDTYSPYCKPHWKCVLGTEVPVRSELIELVQSTRLEF